MRTKVVFSVEARGDEEKRKVLQAVTSLLGIDHVYTDTEGKKLIVTVVGSMEAMDVGKKLRKHWATDMIKMGTVQEKAVVSTNKNTNPDHLRMVALHRGKEVVAVRKEKQEIVQVKVREQKQEIVQVKVREHYEARRHRS
ncbi:heavy metal-associated isoprenylated plant protein 39-like [Nymphaea colorata]|nr:heavy metal-associated isoprenylated plant protein 39-like [Nymphaea colorata]